MKTEFTQSEVSMASIAKLLGHPARVAIISFLREHLQGVQSGVIAEAMPLGRTTIIQHLNALKDGGLVEGVLNGGQILYRLSSEKISDAAVQFSHFFETLSGAQTEMPAVSKKEKLLFLCTGNSCRSQMAEAFFRHYGKETIYEPYSAGTRPAEEIHPLAIQVMEERGISLKEQYPKNTDQFRGDNTASLVLFVCSQAEKDCPLLFPHARRMISLPFDDPASAVGTEEEIIQEFRRVRDEIEKSIVSMIVELQ